MAYKGKRITNPVNKQTIEFITTAKDSSGKELEMISTWAPHSLKPIAHYHPFQEEFFKVVEGELTVLLNNRTHNLKKGEMIHIPASAVHAMWNESDREVKVNWKVLPALDTEYFLETGMGLAADGKTNKKGMPGILQVALLANRYGKEFRLSKPHYKIQKIILSLLTPFALLAGKRSFYRQYID